MGKAHLPKRDAVATQRVGQWLVKEIGVEHLDLQLLGSRRTIRGRESNSETVSEYSITHVGVGGMGRAVRLTVLARATDMGIWYLISCGELMQCHLSCCCNYAAFRFVCRLPRLLCK